MQITDVRVRRIEKEGKMKAIVSITLDNDQSNRRGEGAVHRYAEPQSCGW